MKRYASIFLAGLVSLLMATAQAVPITISFVLSSEQENNPLDHSPGNGVASVTVDAATDLLTVDVIFDGLTSGTTASHIHCCTPFGVSAGVATTTPTFAGFPLGVTSGTFHTVLNMTLASSYNPAFIALPMNGGSIPTAEQNLFAGILGGQAYLNIHTAAFPGGEIRGQIARDLPEPASLALLFAGLAAAGFSGRRRPAA